MRIVTAIVVLCAIGAFASWIALRDDNHWRNGDRRHASRGIVRAALIALAGASAMIGALICSSMAAHARPSPYPVTAFEGDKYSAKQAVAAKDVRQRIAKVRYSHPTRKRAPVSRKRWRDVPTPKPRPGTVERLSGAEPVESAHSYKSRHSGQNLNGVVEPLAAKAREIVADCGSTVISGVRHSFVAGTGGRLSLHAAGRAVDVKGNPTCIYSKLRNWPGGVSTDYGTVQHVHFSYSPHGPEWGSRFRHWRGGYRHHRRRT